MTTVDPFSESELLEFIEGQLAPRRVASLRRRLADHPEIEALVDRLRGDHAVLRATDEPALPIDFVAELEPQLARAAVATSVAESAPGAYRRRHRQAVRRTHRARSVAAAGLLLAVLGATWAAMQLVARSGPGPIEVAERGDASAAAPTGSSRDTPSDTPTDTPTDTTTRAAAPLDAALALDAPGPRDDASWPPAGAEIHHAMPLPGAVTAAVAPGAAKPAASPAAPVVGRFALAVRSVDHDAGERALQTALAASGPGGADVALVRNYTAAEAAQLVARMHRGGLLADEPPDLISGVARATGDPQRRARRLAGILRRHDDSVDDEIRTSRQLLGPKTLAPSYECQLDLSGLGATHTITLRVGDLAALIARLHESGATELRPLVDPAGATDDRPALQRWIDHHAIVRAFLDEHGEDEWLMLPVIIEP